MIKRVLSVLLALCLVIGAVPLTAMADEPDTIESGELDIAENDELFAGYVERLFYGSMMEDAGISTYADASHNAGSRLTGNSRLLYDGLKAEIIKIAKGERESAEVIVSVPYSSEMIHPVVMALLSDCPYELFWFDKSRGWSYGGRNGNTSTCVMFCVGTAYSKTGAASTFEVNTSKMRSVQTAANNAKSVVSNAARLSDYEKLVAYKEYICNAVTYDTNAANSGSAVVGVDPWQLIYVFDGNPNTNVVCEGYSKAFQYLCDMTTFIDKTIQCYSVGGAMDGGGHMWNIVTIGTRNYLVDVTNCDGVLGEQYVSVGFPDRLFLVGYYSGSASSGYIIRTGRYDTPSGGYYGSRDISYVYDSDQFALFGSVLNLSDTRYDPSSAPPVVRYTVTFLNPLNMTYSTQEVINGLPYGALPTPSMSGYVFEGWYSDTSFTRRVTADTIVNLIGDQTLYAKMTPEKPVTVTVKNAGSGVLDVYPAGGRLEATLSAPAGKRVTGYTTSIYSTSGSLIGTRRDTSSVTTNGQDYSLHLDLSIVGGGTVTSGVTINYGDFSLTVGTVYQYDVTVVVDGATYRSSRVRFRLVPTSSSVAGFTDVNYSAYYADAVAWAVENGITSGTSATTFGPDNTCTRAQIMTFLWHAAGDPAPKTTVNPFIDVPNDIYYTKAVMWAVENSITSGTGNGTFSPDRPCTREQAMAFIYHAAGNPNPGNVRNPFTDVPSGEYYYNPVLWAVGKGVTTGTSSTTFGTGNPCKRAQIIQFLYKAYN